MSIPAVFISHGAPDIVLQDIPARHYLERLSETVGRPDAIVINSAHFETSGPVVVTDPHPEMIYDFGGFQPELYQMVYPAPGSPELAKRVGDLLGDAGFDPRSEARRGYDHGTWTTMKLAFPDADIPIVQLSIDPSRGAAFHHALGSTLAPLREENVLLVGSGHITHNLRAVFGAMRSGIMIDPQMPEKVASFTEWLAERFAEGDEEAILDWKNRAPFFHDNHPTGEHLMPLFFAYGAGGNPSGAKRAHHSVQYKFFANESWVFGA